MTLFHLINFGRFLINNVFNLSSWAFTVSLGFRIPGKSRYTENDTFGVDRGDSSCVNHCFFLKNNSFPVTVCWRNASLFNLDKNALQVVTRWTLLSTESWCFTHIPSLSILFSCIVDHEDLNSVANYWICLASTSISTNNWSLSNSTGLINFIRSRRLKSCCAFETFKASVV